LPPKLQNHQIGLDGDFAAQAAIPMNGNCNLSRLLKKSL